MEVIAIFDIGKTNKKLLLFDRNLQLLEQEEHKFDIITDDEGFECDNLEQIEKWIKKSIDKLVQHNVYQLKAINFATYGATLVYLDENRKRITPAYNYLKPMPKNVLEGFYEKYCGIDEFSRITASPALGMLNSGFQSLWLKKCKPEIFRKVKYILHFPQYLSYLFTGKISSEYTSIGCHTALWNFDKMCYYQWLKDEEIQFPEPISNSRIFDVEINGKIISFGIGIHDSSSSLVPYFKKDQKEFSLASTGTWCIFMNPFNNEPLTADQLKKDCLCYLSVIQKQVKSSRFFMGHIHDVNVKRITGHFGVDENAYKKVKPDIDLMLSIENNNNKIFFKRGIPENFIDESVNLDEFDTFEKAYHQFMYDLTQQAIESFRLVLAENDTSNIIYISGGFVRNKIFVKLIASAFPDKKVYTSEIDNSTALGAALVVYECAFKCKAPEIDLKLVKQ